MHKLELFYVIRKLNLRLKYTFFIILKIYILYINLKITKKHSQTNPFVVCFVNNAGIVFHCQENCRKTLCKQQTSKTTKFRTADLHHLSLLFERAHMSRQNIFSVFPGWLTVVDVMGKMLWLRKKNIKLDI